MSIHLLLEVSDLSSSGGVSRRMLRQSRGLIFSSSLQKASGSCPRYALNSGDVPSGFWGLFRILSAMGPAVVPLGSN